MGAIRHVYVYKMTVALIVKYYIVLVRTIEVVSVSFLVSAVAWT